MVAIRLNLDDRFTLGEGWIGQRCEITNRGTEESTGVRKMTILELVEMRNYSLI